MRLAVFADIHANRQAFSACLAFARARGAERIVCLGDVVGYGADPEWAVDTVMGLVEDGAIAVIGNHDQAISTPSESMNAVFQKVRQRLRGASRPLSSSASSASIRAGAPGSFHSSAWAG